MMIVLLKTSTTFAATPAIIPLEKNHLCNKTRILLFSEFAFYLLQVHGMMSCLLKGIQLESTSLEPVLSEFWFLLLEAHTTRRVFSLSSAL